MEAAYAHQHLGQPNESSPARTVAELLNAGRTLTATDYFSAELARRHYRAELDALFSSVDAIALPVMAHSDIKEVAVGELGPDHEIRTQNLRLNCPPNATGHPSLALPCGFSENGLPPRLSKRTNTRRVLCHQQQCSS